VANLSIPDSLTVENAPGYTQLWLRYFSTPSRRERISELSDGLALGHGKYKVVGHIGAGGQGNAYLAMDSSPLPQAVVLKEYIMPVHKGTARLEQTLQKLNNEANILQSINHDQIVRCLDCFVEDYRGYLVLEYVDGQTLKELVAAEGAQPEKTVIDIALQMCDILQYLHALTPPVVHRDIAPDNIMLPDTGKVKLVDFNVAHRLETIATATVVGKHAFIPPEQFRGKPTAQSDIYALGCTMYFLLIGDDPEPISQSHPRSRNATVSEGLDLIVARATTPDASKRYQSVDELRYDLLQLG